MKIENVYIKSISFEDSTITDYGNYVIFKLSTYKYDITLGERTDYSFSCSLRLPSDHYKVDWLLDKFKNKENFEVEI